MCDNRVYPMSLNGDTFNAMKSDFDQLLRKLITGMEKFECEDSTINIKVAVHLEKDQARDFEVSEYEAMRDIVKPTFKHEISSAMQVKDKKTGTLGGNYELVWDRESGQYVMRNIDDGQVTLFDNEQLQKKDPPALPGGNVIEADFSMVEDDGQEDGCGQEDDSEDAPADAETPFDYLRRFVGAKLKVLGTEHGIYTVRTEDGIVVLSSGFQETDLFYCPAEKMESHVGHEVVCVLYGEGEDANITIECGDCCEELFDIDASPQYGEGEGEDADYPYTDLDDVDGEEAEE